MKTATIRALHEPRLEADGASFSQTRNLESEAINLLLTGPASQGTPLPRGDSERHDARDVREDRRGEDLHDYPRVSTTSSRRWASDAGISDHGAV